MQNLAEREARMTTGWKLYWVLVAVTLAVYLAMLIWTLPAISAAAGGLAPFDLRPTGYSFEDAQAFLVALPSDSVKFYQNTQHRLDAIFPALVGAVLAIGLWQLSRAWSVKVRLLLVMFPLAGAVSDYLENSAVAKMLVAGGDLITPEMVELSSNWTVLKSVANSFSMISLLGFLLVVLSRAMKNRGVEK